MSVSVLIRALLVAGLAGTAMACDPTYAVVLDNQSNAALVVARVLASGDGPEHVDPVIAPPGRRTTLGTFGVASMTTLVRVAIMTEDCTVLSDELLGEGFSEGGVIVVAPSLDVSFSPGGNPPRGDDPKSTSQCGSTIDQF